MVHPTVHQRFRSSVVSALAKFGETAELDHAGLKGHFREIFIADLLRQVLSADIIAGTGLVVDHVGGTSNEADVIIFDRFHIPAVLYKESEGYFPIEGVSYYGEVKSRLTASELGDSIRKFRTFKALSPLPNAQGQIFWPPRFLFAWSSDLQGNDIESELDRYIRIDEYNSTAPACSILCVVGKGYCYIARTPEGSYAWYKVGNSDGVQEVVDFIGGVANSLVELRLGKFGMRFGNYIIPYAPSIKLRDSGN